MQTPNHPRRDDLALENVLAALGDPIRMAIVRQLASCPKSGAMNCAKAAEKLAKLAPSTRTHHLRILREAGIVRSRREGVQVLNELRKDDLEARFPGLLHSILTHH